MLRALLLAGLLLTVALAAAPTAAAGGDELPRCWIGDGGIVCSSAPVEPGRFPTCSIVNGQLICTA